MNATIVCPNCNTSFETTDAIRQQLQQELRKQMQDWKDQQVKDFQLKENQFLLEKSKLEQEYQRQIKESEEKLKSKLIAESEAKFKIEFEKELKHLTVLNEENEKKLEGSRQKELQMLKQLQELKQKEQELDIQMQKQLIEERELLKEQIRKEEDEKSKLKDQENKFKMKEMEIQLEQQRKLVDEMKRKAEQGSMQLQGEIQEILLEVTLKQAFPFDIIEEIGKGVRGGDCVQIVRNQFGQSCGKILFESKRTNAFSNDWLDKVKADMRSKSADLAVIVTQALPKDIEHFGLKQGVWVTSFSNVNLLITILREQIIKVFQANKNNEQKTDKMSLLYDYLTSNEFGEQWKAIQEGFMNMRNSIQKERDAMEKLWKSREKQLEKILLSAAHIKGSVEGISGESNIDFDLLDSAEESFQLT
jgi:hypothetical protein